MRRSAVAAVGMIAIVCGCVMADGGETHAGKADGRPSPRTIEAFTRPIASGKPVWVVAHRGFSGAAPENTMAAFHQAIEAGADMIELDVYLSRDGEVVCFHDDELDRTSDGTGLIWERTLEELKQLDAGSWFSEEFKGEPIPTLAEVLDLVKGKILLDIEIKGSAVTDEIEGGIAQKVLQLVEAKGMREEVLITSFDPRALKHVRELDDDLVTMTLYDRKLQEKLAPPAIMQESGSNGFILSKDQVTVDVVNSCHEAERHVSIYTVNDRATMKYLISLGVDSIITNQPDVLIELLKEGRVNGAK